MEDFKKIYLPIFLVCCGIFLLFFLGLRAGWFDGEKPKISTGSSDYSYGEATEEVVTEEAICEEAACEEGVCDACEEGLCDADVEAVEELEYSGEGLFEANCSSCHYADSDMVGPALSGARKRWQTRSSEDNLYRFIEWSDDLVDEEDSYTLQLQEKWDSDYSHMFYNLSRYQIDMILQYVNDFANYEPF